MIRKDALASSRKIRRRKVILKLLLYFFAIFCIFALSVGFFYIPKFKIKEIEVKGASELNKEKLRDEFLAILQRKSLGLFPYGNIFIFPKQRLKAEILGIHPDIKKLDFESFFPERILVEVEERELFAVWCFAEGDCFFVDKDGFAFKKAPFFHGNLFLKFFDERGENPFNNIDKGRQVLSEDDFKNLISFIEFVKVKGTTVSKIFVKDDGIYNLETMSGWRIILDNGNDAQEAFQNFKIMIESLTKEDYMNKIDYVDLRFGNKIFYKISDE